METQYYGDYIIETILWRPNTLSIIETTLWRPNFGDLIRKQAKKFIVLRLKIFKFKIQNFVSKLRIFIYVSDPARTD